MSARGWRDLLSDASFAARLSLDPDNGGRRWELQAEAEWLLGEAVAARGLLLSASNSNDGDRGRLATRPGPVTLVKGAPVHHLPTSDPGGNT